MGSLKYKTGDTAKVLGVEVTITEIEMSDGHVSFILVADELLSSQRISLNLKEFGEVNYHQEIVDGEVEQTLELELETGEVWNAWRIQKDALELEDSP